MSDSDFFAICYSPVHVLSYGIYVARISKLNRIKLFFNNTLFFREDDSTHVRFADRLVNLLNYTPLQQLY